MAFDIRGLHDTIICAKFTFRFRVEKSHIFERSTSDQNSGLTGDWAALGLDRIDLKTEVVV